MQNTDDDEKLLDIDSWFDEDEESNMIFIFVTCSCCNHAIAIFMLQA